MMTATSRLEFVKCSDPLESLYHRAVVRGEKLFELDLIRPDGIRRGYG